MLYLNHPQEIKAAILELAKHQLLWLDTEIAAYWTPNPRLSLIQVLADNCPMIFDVLDKPRVVEFFVTHIMVNPNLEKVFHNAPFDLKYLGGKQRATNVTCTLKMARKITKHKLGTDNLKLKTLAVQLCNFTDVDRETGESNWGKRPLSDRQIDYAKMDVVYLAKVHQYLLDFAAVGQVNSGSIPAQLAQKSSTTMTQNNSFSVTQVRVAFECPRLFYLNYHRNCKSLFMPTDGIKGVGNIFHQQAAKLIDFIKQEPKIKELWRSPVNSQNVDKISLKIRQLFYKQKFYDFLEAKTKTNSQLVPAIQQVWLGLSNLIDQWSKLLTSNRSRCEVNQLFSRTFIGQEVKFEHEFLLPDGSKQKLVGKFDSLIYDLVKNRPCVVEYKTYAPVDPASQLAQVALYSYILWRNKNKINDSAVYCVLPEFKAYNYTWEELKATVHQLIPPKLLQMQQWVNWQAGQATPPPATTSPSLCHICPQQKQCQALFATEITPVAPTPPIEIKSSKTTSVQPKSNIDTKSIGQELVNILQAYNFSTTYKGAAIGASFIRIKLKPELGVKVVSIINRSEDLKVQLAIDHPPLIAAQAGYVSVDLPRSDRQTANFYDYIKARQSAHSKVNIALGINLEGKLMTADLSDPNTCHFLVGGTTGSGKSEFLRSLLLSLLYTHSPQQLKIALVDPKRVTFPEFEENPWLFSSVVKDSESAIALMAELVTEMERRYQLFEAAKCPQLDAYNLKYARQLHKQEPRIVCIFDEYADFMNEKVTRSAIEDSIKRLGAMARAAGIHLIVATQRPEAKVVTPLIRSNLPGRVALRTASEADSKIILGGTETKAAYLLGKGDLLYKSGSKLARLQSLFAAEISLPSNFS